MIRKEEGIYMNHKKLQPIKGLIPGRVRGVTPMYKSPVNREKIAVKEQEDSLMNCRNSQKLQINYFLIH